MYKRNYIYIYTNGTYARLIQHEPMWKFKSVGWFKKVLSHASITAKFEALFVELDRVLTVCGFALEVSDK